MSVIQVDRLDDPRLDDYRSVSDAELLRRRGLFVAEGRLVVGRLLGSGHRVVSALMNDASFRALESELLRLSPEAPVFICETDDFASITGFDLHRGCLALAERPAGLDLEAVSEDAKLLLVLEGVTDADNVGSAFRNAAAFGVDGVVLSPACCDPLYRKAIRTSMGSVLRMPFVRSTNWPADLALLKTGGFTIVALTPERDAITLSSCAPRRVDQKLALLVGSEGPGLSAAARMIADMAVQISMAPGMDCVNLATATGIALHQFAAFDSGTRAPGRHDTFNASDA